MRPVLHLDQAAPAQGALEQCLQQHAIKHFTRQWNTTPAATSSKTLCTIILLPSIGPAPASPPDCTHRLNMPRFITRPHLVCLPNHAVVDQVVALHSVCRSG